MLEVAHDRAERKWYHVVWQTYRRRPLFKIRATARFCERELRRRLLVRNWDAAAVYVAPAQVHVLVRPPLSAPRAAVLRECQRHAALAAAVATRASPGREPLWEAGAWCGVVTPGTGVAAVRRWLAARTGAAELPLVVNTPGASAPP